MDLSSQNLEFLESWDPQLLQDLDRVEGLPSTLVPSSRGLSTLTIGNHFFHDPVDPELEAQSMVGRGPQMLHVHFGFGLGYFLEADQTTRDGQILIYEPNPDFVRQAMNYRALESLFRNRSARLFVDFGRFFYALIKQRTLTPTYRLFVSAHHAGFFTAAFQEFQQALQAPSVLPPIAEMPIMPQILKSTIKSMPWYLRCPGFQHWRSRLEGRPAVVVASGPSLDRNLPELAAQREKVVVFAIARTAPILAEYGIAPDFLVHVEAQSYHYLIQACPNLEKTVFLLADQAQQAFYASAPQRTFVFRSRANQLSNCLVNRFPTLDHEVIKSGGSVATAALYLAFLMGCNPLIIIGQDLAIGNSGQYAGGQEADRERAGLRVDGYFGGKVSTFPNYNNNIQWYQQSVPALLQMDPDRVFINASEGGARLEPLGQQKLRAVLSRLPVRVRSWEYPNPPCATPVPWQDFLAEGQEVLQILLNLSLEYKKAEQLMLMRGEQQTTLPSPEAMLRNFVSCFQGRTWWEALFKRELTMANLLLGRYRALNPPCEKDLFQHWATGSALFLRVPQLARILGETVPIPVPQSSAGSQ